MFINWGKFKHARSVADDWHINFRNASQMIQQLQFHVNQGMDPLVFCQAALVVSMQHDLFDLIEQIVPYLTLSEGEQHSILMVLHTGEFRLRFQGKCDIESMIAALKKGGLNLNARDSEQKTALITAVEKQDEELVRALLNNGADPYAYIENYTAPEQRLRGMVIPPPDEKPVALDESENESERFLLEKLGKGKSLLECPPISTYAEIEKKLYERYGALEAADRELKLSEGLESPSHITRTRNIKQMIEKFRMKTPKANVTVAQALCREPSQETPPL